MTDAAHLACDPHHVECLGGSGSKEGSSCVSATEWIREGPVSGEEPPTAPETARACARGFSRIATEPFTCGTASDGDTSRILQADRRDFSAWNKRGIVIDAGFAGESDAFGVESPCVVQTPGGYLMAYGRLRRRAHPPPPCHVR